MKSNDSKNLKNKRLELNKHIKKIKDNTTFIAKSTMDFVDDTTNSIFSNIKNNDNFYKKDYDESLEYIRTNRKTKIEFPVDDSSKEKLSKLLSPDVVGSAGGLIGAAATVGVVGTTLGTGLIVVGAGALLGGLIAKHSDNVEWIPSELFIWDEELVISGKFSINFDEIKHIGIDDGEMVIITLKDQPIQFKTYNAKALKTVIEEKMDMFYAN